MFSFAKDKLFIASNISHNINIFFFFYTKIHTNKLVSVPAASKCVYERNINFICGWYFSSTTKSRSIYYDKIK